MNATRFESSPTTVQDLVVLRRSDSSLPVLRRSAIDVPVAKREPRPKKLNWLRLIAAVATVVVITVFQPWKVLHSEPVASVNQAAVVEPLKAVTIARPQSAASSNVVLPATIRPWQATTLHARVSGYLTAWNKDLGANVQAGEVLAVIETPELDQEVAQADASAQEATAAAVQARAELQESESELKVAESQLARAQAEAHLAVSQLARRDRLLASQAISAEEHDTFRKQVEARTADVGAAESDVARRRSNLATRVAIITAREATAQSRRANVDRLKELQAFKQIVAPFDGVITSRSAEIGMLVSAGKESLFTMESMDRVRVQVNVPQAYSTQTGPGVVALVQVPDTAASKTGAVTRIAQSVDSASRTMLAEIELDNAARQFQPGSFARVTLSMSQDTSAWTIPTNTLQMRVDGPHVAIVNERDQIELRRVELGRDLGNRVVVVDGIRGNERLIVNPGDDLRDGARVQTAEGVASRDQVAQVSMVSAE